MSVSRSVSTVSVERKESRRVKQEAEERKRDFSLVQLVEEHTAMH